MYTVYSISTLKYNENLLVVLVCFSFKKIIHSIRVLFAAHEDIEISSRIDITHSDVMGILIGLENVRNPYPGRLNSNNGAN